MWTDCAVLRQRLRVAGLGRIGTSTNLVGDSQQIPSSVQYSGLPFLVRGKS